MSEVRRDRTTGAPVIVAPERSHRPGVLQAALASSTRRPVHDPTCPFCPGNEHLLTPVIEEVPTAEGPHWCVRVVSNKYPVLEPGDAAGRTGEEDVLPGYGYHEVIIETPRHDLDLPDLDGADFEAVVSAYHRRYRDLISRPGIESVAVFRNHGHGAGASLEHAHSQVIAANVGSPRLAAIRGWAEHRYSQTGQCVMCQEIETETASAKRIVEASEAYVAMVPFAATAPSEQWIVPRRHAASFGAARPAELTELAGVLKRTLTRLRAAHGDARYRLAIESADAANADTPFLHWRVRIVPMLVIAGGFELATEIPINPSLPEDDAAALRAAAIA